MVFFHGSRVRRGPPVHSPVEGVRSGQRQLVPNQEMPANQESGVSAGEEDGRVETRRPVGRGEQLAPRMENSVDIQGR